MLSCLNPNVLNRVIASAACLMSESCEGTFLNGSPKDKRLVLKSVCLPREICTLASSSGRLRRGPGAALKALLPRAASEPQPGAARDGNAIAGPRVEKGPIAKEENKIQIFISHNCILGSGLDPAEAESPPAAPRGWG